jgi:hypothetical protein
MLVDLEAPQLEALSVAQPNTNEMTDMYIAWDRYVKDTMEALTSFKQNNEWLFDVKDIHIVQSLITDLQEMTAQIPYKDKTVDMTNMAHMWFSVCPENHPLKRFFK